MCLLNRTRKISQKKVLKRDWVENFGNEEVPSLLLTLGFGLADFELHQ